MATEATAEKVLVGAVPGGGHAASGRTDGRFAVPRADPARCGVLTHPGVPRAPGAVGRAGPRDRLLAAGAAAVATADLLAVLLGPGAAALDLLEHEGGLRSLATRTPEELGRVAGLGPSRAARLLASVEIGRRLVAEPLARGFAIRTSSDVFRHYHPLLRDLRVEQFRIVLLDGKHRVLREELVSQGTLTSSPVHPREVFAPAIRHHAAALVLVHNHPSGDPTPSADDLEITRRLAEVGDLVGIQVLDHVVVGDGCFASLADRGLLHP